ncbi:hypothetical protein AAHK20_18060 [Trinickia sp. YCB016]
MKSTTLIFARRALLVVPLTAALGGCLSSSPIWDAHFGEAERAVTQAQIIDPHAGEHNPSTPGLDGKAAASAMDAYEKSFQAPAPAANQFVIGISSGSSSGSSGGSSGN